MTKYNIIVSYNFEWETDDIDLQLDVIKEDIESETPYEIKNLSVEYEELEAEKS